MQSNHERLVYSAEVKQQIGRNLLSAPRGSQKTTAKVVGVSTRTLRSWKKQVRAGQRPLKRGRREVRATLSELLVIAREWRRQGYNGALAISKALRGLRVRLVREVVAGLKKRRRRRARAHAARHRMSLKVNDPGSLVVVDAAKIPNAEGGEFIVFRDRGSLKTEAIESAGPATCASDMLRVLNELKASARLPLVVGTDNGSPFTANDVEEFMLANKVIHLRSLPYVPQHNCSAENAVGEMKGQIKNGATLEAACLTLNDCRKRQSLSWKTSTEIDEENFRPCSEEKRNEFYTAAKDAIERAVLGTKSAYKKRKAEREAIFQTMESFSLITRIRGQRRA